MCLAQPGSQRVTITDAYKLAQNDDVSMARALLTYGPLATLYDANSLQFYMSGVIGTKDPTSIALPICCHLDECLNHVVTVIGYDFQSSLLGEYNYWIMKNSWGTGWGEAQGGERGYFRVERGSNMCGCETDTNVLEMYEPFA